MLRFLLLPLLILLASFSPSGNRIEYNGVASVVKGNKLMYSEENIEEYQSGRHLQTLTSYKDASGKTFAKRKLDYSKSSLTPDFQLEDTRTGLLEGSNMKGNDVVLFYKKNKSSALKTATLNIPKPFVIDGGFNYFIKARWNELMKGETQLINIAVPSQLDYFKFRIYKFKEQVQGGRKEVVFKIEPDNFLLRNLLDPILTTYNKDTKRMTSYKGISNICSDKGKYLLVNLNYPVTGP
jgi:hypothetical protein